MQSSKALRCVFFICERCENSMCSVLLEKVPKSQHFSRNYGEQRSGTVREENGTTGEFVLFGIYGVVL